MTTVLFEKWISHFITSIQVHGDNLNTTNHPLLFLDGHNSHVTINVVHNYHNPLEIKNKKFRLQKVKGRHVSPTLAKLYLNLWSFLVKRPFQWVVAM
jgi:hypothetical protein